MRYYFAPLEGLTDSIFRSLHHKYFPGVDRYYTPFFSPTVHRSLTPKERRELQIADTLDFAVVPQVLTRNAEDLLWMAQQCVDSGYRELNLNLGCPSGTVTAKKKGSGALQDPEELDRFLDAVFSCSPIPISVKTRIGFSSPEEFPKLLDIFNRYPICELTIHPRTRADFYKGSICKESFEYAVKNSKNPLCYNGNLCSKEAADAIGATYPGVDAVMLGRGLIANPGMLTPGGTTVAALEGFYDELLEAYCVAFGSTKNAMFRMKENWYYLSACFQDGDKLFKKLRKTTDINEYHTITKEVFSTLQFCDVPHPNW